MKIISLLTVLILFVSCNNESKDLNIPKIKTSWSDKRYISIGDSNTDETKVTPIKYPTILFKTLNMKSFSNKGASGMSMAKIPSGNYFTKSGGLLYTTNWRSYDLVTISLSGNDLWSSVPIGDSLSNDNTTFWGAYKLAITHIKKNNPNIIIVLLNHPKHKLLETKNNTGKSSIAYANAVLDIGKYFNIYAIDAWTKSGIDNSNLQNYTIDEIHLNKMGHELYSKLLISEFTKISP